MEAHEIEERYLANALNTQKLFFLPFLPNGTKLKVSVMSNGEANLLFVDGTDEKVVANIADRISEHKDNLDEVFNLPDEFVNEVINVLCLSYDGEVVTFKKRKDGVELKHKRFGARRLREWNRDSDYLDLLRLSYQGQLLE